MPRRPSVNVNQMARDLMRAPDKVTRTRLLKRIVSRRTADSLLAVLNDLRDIVQPTKLGLLGTVMQEVGAKKSPVGSRRGWFEASIGEEHLCKIKRVPDHRNGKNKIYVAIPLSMYADITASDEELVLVQFEKNKVVIDIPPQKGST